MKDGSAKTLRCAIYTRVSTEHGLEQEFNSLHNQREAAEAYVKSQAHEGWRCLKDRYDDGGFSGGSMERPALQRLLEAIRLRLIDVVVVYKVDRLTRSLTDFAKLVELFDAHGVSFVSVTQAFNTTTSMGRLTLNVLLSFAQFEREVTGERIRDKIAASKKKGIWMGGVVPLGYAAKDRALHVVEAHAELVRDLFRRYLELGTVMALKAHFDRKHIRIPERVDGAGRRTGGGSFSRGHLHKILSNPIYVGVISHKSRTYEGQHPPIVDREAWDRVQAQLASHAHGHKRGRLSSESILMGRIRDDRGNLMSPTHARKGARRYRYYVSQAILQGRKAEAGSICRVPAAEVEAAVLGALRQHDEGPGTQDRSGNEATSDPELVHRHLERLIVGRTELQIQIKGEREPLLLPWSPQPSVCRREVIQAHGRHQASARLMKAKDRAKILRGIAKARAWLDELVSGALTDTEAIASREGASERSVRNLLGLALLSPEIVRAIIDGRLPRGIGLTTLADLPADWAQQRSVLGLAPAS